MQPDADDLHRLIIDELTGCLTYSAFKSGVTQILSQFDGSSKYALVYIDIKEFKYFNDMLGYQGGDEILRYIGSLLIDNIQGTDVVARISGDIFVSFRKYEQLDELQMRFSVLSAQLKSYYTADMQQLRIELFGGIYLVEQVADVLTVSEMLDRANLALQTIRDKPGSNIALYDSQMREAYLWQREVESRMYQALTSGEFEVYFQPQIDIQSRNVLAGAEALIRWNYPGKGTIPPDLFIPIFEKNGFIIHLDEYVLRKVCEIQAEFISKGKRPFPIAVNVSRYDLFRPNFLECYTAIKNSFGIPDFLIELEFTETVVFSDHDRFRDIIYQVKENGFLCALDDFGSGNSSLNILKDIPVDVLKIDKQFFVPSNNPQKDNAIIFSIVAMSRALKMRTVSEGIEEPSVLQFLRKIGCNYIQGFVFSRPLPWKNFKELVLETDVNFIEPFPAIYLDRAGKSNFEYINSKYMFLSRFFCGIIMDIEFEQNRYVVESWGEEKVLSCAIHVSGLYSEFLEQLTSQWVHPDDAEELRDKMSLDIIHRSFFNNVEQISADFRMLVNGKITNYSITASRIMLEDYKRFAAVMFIQHIAEPLTQSRQALMLEYEEQLLGVFMNALQKETYIVNTETFEILYINDKLLGRYPNTKCGQLCYKAFYDRPFSCPNCFLSKNSRETGSVLPANSCSGMMCGANGETVRYDFSFIKLHSCKSAALISIDVIENKGVISVNGFSQYIETMSRFGVYLKYGLFFISCTATHHLIYANPMFYSLLGYDEDSFNSALQAKDPHLISNSSQHFYDYLDRNHGKDESIFWDFKHQRPDGNELWLSVFASFLNVSGEFVMIGQLMNISSQKSAEMMKVVDKERLQLFVENSTDIFFDWNFAVHEFVFTGKGINLYGIKSDEPIEVNELLASDIVHADDINSIVESALSVKIGKCPSVELVVRLKMRTGKYLWHRVRFHGIRDDRSNIVQVMGMISEFDNEMNVVNSLKKQVETDLLTSVLNYETFKQTVETALAIPEGWQYAVFLLFDVHDFSAVNERLGRKMGDELLAAIGSVFNRHIKSPAVCSRLNGDSFSVFWQSSDIYRRIEEDVRGICNQICNDDEIVDNHLQFSIGAMIAPIGTADFYHMCDVATKACAKSKNAAFNTCSFAKE